MAERTPRLSGRAAVVQRKRRLLIHPLCARCQEAGQIKPTDEIDHIKPLDHGGSDDDDNVQGLCFYHHKLKSVSEGTGWGGADNHPEWLNPSAIPLTILCGPPCSGKTTYIAQHAGPHDTIIDVDTITQSIDPTYTHWSGRLTPGLLDRAVRTRNAMLGSLDRETKGKAWFIVSAPTKAERDWWHAKLGGQIVLLHPGTEECKRRAVQRGTPNAIKGVDQWERASRQPWIKAKAKALINRVTIGADGWPVT